MLKMGAISIIGNKSNKLRQFYEDLLRNKPVMASGNYMEYEEEKMRWGFDPKELIEKDKEIIVGERQILVQLESDNIEDDFKKMEQVTKVLLNVKKAKWGDRYFFAEDVEGNLLYIYQKK